MKTYCICSIFLIHYLVYAHSLSTMLYSIIGGIKYAILKQEKVINDMFSDLCYASKAKQRIYYTLKTWLYLINLLLCKYYTKNTQAESTHLIYSFDTEIFL